VRPPRGLLSAEPRDRELSSAARARRADESSEDERARALAASEARARAAAASALEVSRLRRASLLLLLLMLPGSDRVAPEETRLLRESAPVSRGRPTSTRVRDVSSAARARRAAESDSERSTRDEPIASDRGVDVRAGSDDRSSRRVLSAMRARRA